MKVVVIGGSGLIGTKLVKKLRKQGRETVAASPSTGVNTITGAGLADALVGAEVVVDVTNAPVFDDETVRQFFETSTRHILAAETAAGVSHHVLLSIVGADRLQDSGYMRAKTAQEAMIKTATVPFTILHATQFFEFLGTIADANTVSDTIHIPPVSVQPVAADDVAAALAEIAFGSPANGIIELAGPEQFRFDELVRQFMSAVQDARLVSTDNQARYFGATLDARSLIPGENAQIGSTAFANWLASHPDLLRGNG